MNGTATAERRSSAKQIGNSDTLPHTGMFGGGRLFVPIQRSNFLYGDTNLTDGDRTQVRSSETRRRGGREEESVGMIVPAKDFGYTGVLTSSIAAETGNRDLMYPESAPGRSNIPYPQITVPRDGVLQVTAIVDHTDTQQKLDLPTERLENMLLNAKEAKDPRVAEAIVIGIALAGISGRDVHYGDGHRTLERISGKIDAIVGRLSDTGWKDNHDGGKFSNAVERFEATLSALLVGYSELKADGLRARIDDIARAF
ncbi:MAG: hypothetical protein V1909_04255 [Candidatus Micrarchaeota archaeon]